MLLAPLAGAALLVSIATGPAVEPQGSPAQLSAQQKNAAMQPLVRSATECIARVVTDDPRFAKAMPSDLGDLIAPARDPEDNVSSIDQRRKNFLTRPRPSEMRSALVSVPWK